MECNTLEIILSHIFSFGGFLLGLILLGIVEALVAPFRRCSCKDTT